MPPTVIVPEPSKVSPSGIAALIAPSVRLAAQLVSSNVCAAAKVIGAVKLFEPVVLSATKPSTRSNMLPVIV